MAKSNTTRRAVVAGIAATGAASTLPGGMVAAQSKKETSHSPKRAWDAIVVGAGVFGAWTATQLQRAGKKVLLVDGRGPASVRASSGGETRLIRSDYGADAIYTKMSTVSLAEWKKLSDDAGLPLFNQTGILFFFHEMVDYARASIETHERLKLPLEVLDAAALRKGFPQFDFSGIEFGLYEVGFGVLMARRSVIRLVERFVHAGGTYRHAEASAPLEDGHSLMVDGRRESADSIIYACGPWMERLFPELLAPRLFITRQELAFVAPPAGNSSFAHGSLPAWADYNGGDLFYGVPDIEGRGFKIANDQHGPAIDPDTEERHASEATYKKLREYLEMRFPGLKGAPFVGERVCQYTNSSNGDFLIDRHPGFSNIILVGAGSGHGFKHGPEVGRFAAALALDATATAEPRFSLGTKATVQNRTVL